MRGVLALSCGCLLVFLLVGGCVCQKPKSTTAPMTTIGALGKTIVASFECHDAAVQSVVSYLSNAVKDQSGVTIEIDVFPPSSASKVISFSCSDTTALEVVFLVAKQCDSAVVIEDGRVTVTDKDVLKTPPQPLLFSDGGELYPILTPRDIRGGSHCFSRIDIGDYPYLGRAVKTTRGTYSLHQVIALIKAGTGVVVDVAIADESESSAREWDRPYMYLDDGEVSVRDLVSRAVAVMNEIGVPRSSANEKRLDEAGFRGDYSLVILPCLGKDRIVMRSLLVEQHKAEQDNSSGW